MSVRGRPSARDAAGLAVGLGVLVGSALIARRPRGESEIQLFRSANELPNQAFPAVWTAMQYGTFGAVPVAATVAVLARKPRLAGSLAVGGTAAWITAKGAKRIVARGRPASIIGGVRQRGAEEGDQGFPSGHAAVSTAMTVIMWREASPRMRVALSALTGLVPFGRMYVGAHLPLDLVGGSALGLALGCTVNLVRGGRAPAVAEPAPRQSR